MSSDHDVVRDGAELVLAKTGRWITPRDLDAGAVVLIHGFTSHGRYMEKLADTIAGYGFCSVLFNYDSYLGIDTAAQDLATRLENIRGSLEHRGFTLVAHSMGGLVARLLARQLDTSLREALRGVVLLGTPHQGALSGTSLVTFMLDWADWLTGPNPYARHPLCRAAQQLALEDSEQLVTNLNRDDSRNPLSVPYLSISGGRPYLELGKSNLPFTGGFRNRLIQKAIGETPNDGLVSERSADFSQIFAPGSSPALHFNSYPEHSRINHTALARSQAVAGIVVRWLTDTARLQPNRVQTGRIPEMQEKGVEEAFDPQ